MFFNSLTFAIFLPIVFFLYWFVFNKTKSSQNLILILASYYFYSCWDWRFLFLLVFSTFLDYATGIQIEKTHNASTRKFWFWLSIGINLGFLAIFKYYNFFCQLICHVIEWFWTQIITIFIRCCVASRNFILHLSWFVLCYRYLLQEDKSRIQLCRLLAVC